MVEGGMDQGIAVLAEGNAVSQTIEGGNINVFAGNQLEGDQVNIPKVFQEKRTAMLAEAERVNQRFSNCDVNVVTGDQIRVDRSVQIHGGQNIQYIYHITREPAYSDGGRNRLESDVCSSGRYDYTEPPAGEHTMTPGRSTEVAKKMTVRPKHNSLHVRLMEKATGQNCANFIKKVNAFSWKNIQGRVAENYDLTEPVGEYYPQMKAGFKLFKGDYLPQDGFSAHCKPKGGEYLDFQKCIDIITKTRERPCVIIGQPGSGKTIMMKRLAKSFLTTNQLQRKLRSGFQPFELFKKEFENRPYDVIFHMNIRDIANTDSGTLAEVIFSPSITGLTTLEVQYGMKSILGMKTKIIMFFDGLDQAAWEPNCDKIIGPWETASTATIFGNILAGHLLSDVPITVSSREHSIARLSQRMRPQFVAALVGFSYTDAKALYCEIMGNDTDNEWDWNSMRKSNPAMHYMCLTPVFLIFYMIARKAYPEYPPDCATGVMVSIIQIFLECENARKIDQNTKIIELLNNLRKMAFQGTKEKRVVFDDEDLKRFNLTYEVISDIIIKVPGLSILGQKILEGMFRFFFSHQTLQEILSALRVVELDYTKFTQVVDEEFPKPYWSVVRSFTCGILNNENVRSRISRLLLKSGDLTRKCEYLMTHLREQLASNRSPADKLDIFIALKEANALDILRGFAEDLDFSNSPLTPAMINTICSVMKYIGDVPHVSFANSGMDDELLEVLAKGTDGLGIKVAKFDLKGNSGCKDTAILRRIFKNLTISDCFLEIQSEEQDEVNARTVLRLLNSSTGNSTRLHFGELKKMRLNIGQLANLSKVQMTVHELYIRPERDLFNREVWRKYFQRISFVVSHCFVESPQPTENQNDVNIWIAAAKAAMVENVKKVSLTSKGISLTIDDIQLIRDANFYCEISDLRITFDQRTYDARLWRQAFHPLTFGVNQCFVEPVQKRVDVGRWLDAVETANSCLMKISSTIFKQYYIHIDICDIRLLSKSTIPLKIDRIKLEGTELQKCDWMELGMVARKFEVAKTISHHCLFPDVKSFVRGHDNIKEKKIYISFGLKMHLRNLKDDLESQNPKSLTVELEALLFQKRPREVGRLIKESDFDTVIISRLGSFIDVSSFASGLNRYKIKKLVVRSWHNNPILSLVSECDVENLFVYQAADDLVLEKLQGHTEVTILSGEDWDKLLR